MEVKIEGQNKKKKSSCGSCIFCLSKCSKCKSIDVTIEYVESFGFTWKYTNKTWNDIVIERMPERGPNPGLFFHCNNCGTELDKDHNKGKKFLKLLSELVFMPTGPKTKITCDSIHAFMDATLIDDNKHEFIKIEWTKTFNKQGTFVTDNFSYKKDLGKLRFMKEIKGENLSPKK